jgi:hypothetical protein
LLHIDNFLALLMKVLKLPIKSVIIDAFLQITASLK